MTSRLRKLAGTILLVAFISIYALIAMTIAAARLPGTSGLWQLVYYVVAGLIWVLPAGLILRWMLKAPK